MNKHKYIPAEEAIKWLTPNLSNENIDILFAQIMATEFEQAPSLEKEEALFARFNTNYQYTLGQLLSNRIMLLEKTIPALAEETRLPVDLIQKIVADRALVTNIPIVLFSKLLKQLQISFLEVGKAIMQSAEIIKSNSGHAFNGRSTIFARKDKQSFFEISQQEGQMLFESDEAIQMYLKRLDEILNS
ncbi:hypothetical protein [Runella aurantiaca]|uniref:Uncharacterized protein n=1 Tax=Runella aurantiaca TaxID=2282308 RepID=A0A369IHH7_9BACT|nr:hypothetical protein [Runella aurantiaca]RDB07797.1 hypothetical protein DVG78_01710 [Runella aurantiaca]